MALDVCVYAICKDEAAFAARWMESMREADGVYVTDTGSKDKTVEILRRAGARVFEETVSPWRFDEARNRSLAHLPQGADICVCTDLDETWNPGWRARLEAAWTPGTTLARYLYNWRLRPDGTPELQYPYAKIHAREGYRWVHPVHEVLTYDGAAERAVWVDGMVLTHRPDPAKPRAQYLPLLELSAKENPRDAQTCFWLGREYWFHRRAEDAARTLERYLALSVATWDEERCAAMRLLARCAQAKRQEETARRWLWRAAGECPALREPFWQLAWHAYQRQDWPLLFWAARRGLDVKQPSGSYLTEAEAWGPALDDFAALACWHLGLLDEAETHAARAAALRPQDERLCKNLALIRKARG